MSVGEHNVENRISVIIPTFNRIKFLDRAIESVLRQTYRNFEVIIADDGSTDGTSEMLATHYRNEAKVRTLSLDHGGANRARNTAVESASGSWIAFLDSDDWWAPQKLAKQMRALKAEPASIAAFTGIEMRSQDSATQYVPKVTPSLLDLRRSNSLSSTSTALILRDAFNAAGGFDPDLPSCQDWDLWFRLRKIGPFVLVREILSFLDTGMHSRISTDWEAVAAGHNQMFERLREGIEDTRELRFIDAGHNLVLAEHSLQKRAFRKALKLSIQSLRLRPSPWAIRLAALSLQGMMRGYSRRQIR